MSTCAGIPEGGTVGHSQGVTNCAAAMTKTNQDACDDKKVRDDVATIAGSIEMPVFESRTDLHTTVEQLFEFIIRPANLQAIAPPEMQFVYVQPPEVISMGSQLTCKAQAYGMIQQLKYEIVELKSPTSFREKMVDGPLQLWLHDYIIETHSSSGLVTLVNRIEFEPPGGLMGFLVTADKILDALDDGFDFRRGELQKRFAKSGSRA